MNKLFLSLCLSSITLSFADRVINDNTMAAAEQNEHGVFEDRGSFGPYVEFNNIKMKNVDYSYKIYNQKHFINIDNSYIYGASGSLPITEWFDIYLMAGYQYLGISLDSSDIEGRHQIHTALFQFGFDLALPIVASYNHQFMLKLYAFAGGLFGKTFFSDDTEFLSPVLFGYAYGAGIRTSWHSFFLSGGVRSSHEYFHTYFERKLSDTKDGDEFMLDIDMYFQPYVSLGITLF